MTIVLTLYFDCSLVVLRSFLSKISLVVMSDSLVEMLEPPGGALVFISSQRIDAQRILIILATPCIELQRTTDENKISRHTHELSGGRD